jgi:ribose/xylose/arabinose/galactoside ABC-type transport system permease subunit
MDTDTTTKTAPFAPPGGDSAAKVQRHGRRVIERIGGLQSLALLALLAAMIVGFSLASPFFLSVRNLTNMLLSVSVIGTMAALSTLVLVGRGLDLSVGSIVGLVGVVAAAVLEKNYGWPAALGAAIVVGALCGAVNGLITVRLGINSIIVTIGTLSIFRGIAYVATDGQTLSVADPVILDIGSARIFGIPWAALLMVAVFVGCHVFGTYTRAGRTLYAIGANPRASRLSGIDLGRYRFGIFIASGISAAIAGVLLIGQSATAVPAAGVGYELLVITAVLLGGTSLHGGEGRVSGTLIGVLIIGVLNNGMTLLGINSYYQIVAHGVLLLAAVAIDQARRGTQPQDE